ncbi:putative major facilitator superfamily transporter [Rhizodiscina lignyota]|uniref:Major facilitator superfamily transporter n=1 Tax=Rhizodiscina lignyota TaxID=1504668 RepID=A0A9P4IC62_9PEZI|nr:putative major facilitator superfamily transporter [Rhizodiscina lignyota]
MDETQPLLASANILVPEQPQTTGQRIIEFHPDGDSENPLEWKKPYKWFIVLLLAFMAFTVTFTCIGVVPVAGRIVEDLDGRPSKSASVLLVTIWELGEAAGPLLIAPLSELYGRYPVFNVANILFIVGVAITALSENSHVFIFARFLTGIAVASNVLNPAIIGDMFPSEERGSGMSLIMLAPLLGGAVGPAIAGAIAESSGWRRIMWMSLILASVAELAFLTLFRETYKVPILQRKAARLRQETGDESLKTAFDNEVSEVESALWNSIMRPSKVFLGSPVLQIMSLYGGVVFSFFYIMSTTLPDILQDIYEFPPALTGTSFMTFSVGSTIGVIVCNLLLDRIYVRMGNENDGKLEPENRLPLVIFGAFCLPAIITLYGFIAQEHWPVALMLISVGALGFLVILGLVPVMSYVVDAFGLYSASAMTAVLITRCLMGTFMPLATAPLTNKLGYGFGFLVLASLVLVVAPIPVFVMRYGARWRSRSEYSKGD